MPHVARAAWPVAVLCAAWTALFSRDEPPATLLAVPLVLAGVALLPRHVRRGTALVLLAALVSLLAGASWGNVDTVAPFAVALFATGRMAASRWQGACAVLVAAASSFLREGITPEKVAITLGLYGSMWFFGIIVRRRALDALSAVARAEQLAGQDPSATAAERAVEERSRLAEEALFALRTSVIAMRTTARQAATHLDPRVVRAVHERGGFAVDELRALLGLLREPADTAPGPSAPEPEPRTDQLWRAPLVWCLVLAGGTLLLVPAPPEDPDVLLPGAAAYALVTWRIGTRPSRTGIVGLGVLAACGTWLSTSYGTRGTAFILFVLGAAFLAGLAWGERDRIYRGAEERERELRARLTAATSSAVRAERLRLARELHDVAGHAVGAMVLQAGAAAALLDRDEQAARDALRTVDTTGEEALREVDEMLAALDTGEFGDFARSYAGPGRLQRALEDLVTRMRASGTHVRASLTALPTSPALTATTYRVVHEAVTNAVRHAPGARVEITARREGDSYVVRVSDDGAGESTQQGTGYGLEGLRERVAACEGSFAAGPGRGGGFVVEARLPAITEPVA